jgi:hypothetical protein
MLMDKSERREGFAACWLAASFVRRIEVASVVRLWTMQWHTRSHGFVVD